MGIFKNLLTKSTYETGANYQLGHSISSTNIFGHGGDNIDIATEYSGYVWKAVNVRAEELAAQNFFVERKVGEKWQEDTNHEFNKVIAGEDGGYDESELLQYHSTSMDMYGESFWYFSKGERSNKPFATYILDPTAMTVMIADFKVTGYVYQKESDRVVFDLDEIAHFRADVGPQNPYRGVGPMQKASWFVRSNRYAVTYVNNFLENNGIPAGVVVAKEGVNDDDWKLFKDQWKSSYGGVANAGKTAFVRGQDLDFVKTGVDIGEVDFKALTNNSRDDILGMFSVPKSRLGQFENFNLASAAAAEEAFMKTFTKTAVERIKNKLTRKITKWYGAQFRYGSDFELPEDRTIKLKEVTESVNIFRTVNEAREEYGLPALGKEYDVLTPQGQAPVEPKPKVLGKVTIRTKNNKADFSYEMKENFRSQTEALQIKFEKQFVQATNPILEAQKTYVLAQANPKKAIESKFDVAKETEKMDNALTPIFMEMAAAQGSLALTFAANDSATFKLTPVMQQFIRDSVHKANLGFTEETQVLVAQAVAEGLEEGLSTAKIAVKLSDIYDDVLGSGYRMERISRTEIIKASNAVTEAAYRQSGVVNKKEWFANPGHCQFCASLNGSIISLGADFVSEGATIEGADGGTRVNSYEAVKHPPIHPQCRCTLIPVIEG